MDKAPDLYGELEPKLRGERPLEPREEAALHFAERMAAEPQGLDEAFMGAMRQQFSDPELVELGLVTGAFLMLGRLHAAFGVASMPEATHQLLDTPRAG